MLGFILGMAFLLIGMLAFAFGLIWIIEWWCDRPPKELKQKNKLRDLTKENDELKAQIFTYELGIKSLQADNEAMRVLLGYPTMQQIVRTEREIAMEAAKAAIREEYPEIQFKDEQ